jgi:hypothetical protein
MMIILALLITGLLHAQDNLSRLEGNFITCQKIQLLGLASEHVRPDMFKCPNAQGYVMNETPVKKISINIICPGQKELTLSIVTPATCNTLTCLNQEPELKKLVHQNSSKACSYQMTSADLFEYYPIFKTSGPNLHEKFLDSKEYNTEADPDYLSRINGGYSKTSTSQEDIQIQIAQPSKPELTHEKVCHIK